MNRFGLAAAASLALLASCARAPEPPPGRVVRPGAPGAASRVVAEGDGAAAQTFTQADVSFMQGMIAHHAQAIVMSGLVSERTRSDDIVRLAGRIGRSQTDEIARMSAWLSSRGQEVPEPPLEYRPGAETPPGMLMPGMLTAEELGSLAGAEGNAFDRLFLTYMIGHHEGAVTMVEELFENPGAGQESEIYQVASDIERDQRIEIARMIRLLNERG